MSLSTQLVRGTLALPMLCLFALIGILAGQTADAGPVRRLTQIEINAPVCSLQIRHGLVLAQAPADLEPLAMRASRSCHA
jgi:hypothetical protein